jgi:hypothetical protein
MHGRLEITADRRGYWCALEPSLVRAELADRGAVLTDRQRALMLDMRVSFMDISMGLAGADPSHIR